MRSIPLVVLVISGILMVSCGTNKNKPVSDQPEPAKVIPVGMALAQFEAMETEPELKSANQITVKVSQIIGYGATAGLLQINSVINLFIPSHIESEVLYNKTSGSSFRALVKKQPPLMGADDRVRKWEIVEIKKQQ